MKKYQAVITADMVNSTRYPREKTTAWLDEMIDLLRNDPSFDWALKPEIYRGDSFQGVLKNYNEAMHAAILARASMRKHATNTDLRIAIGIGKTEQLTDRAGTSDGEAFRLSGRLADNIRKQKARIGIALPTPSEPLNASLDLLETLIENWTVSQSEVVLALLQKKTITQIAEQLGISQPAASQRVAASKWWAIENFLATFPKHLSLYTKTKS
ncbi:SatD family protein [Dyadobacter sp. CY326]|uniref:SatD family protein n=1 Tax=Dyadobacter sp. CY326 TaxID=2907300 RepID=UPI001F33DC88|nr:SatD family protein [Dyadobacter sp. CY326]MCE7066758.1 SatD family protein [Dyadobacter sp. CY326]